MAMDVKRDPKILKRKKLRRILLAIVGGIAVVAISVAVSQLEPASPTVPANTVWFGTVKRGPMVREVRGAGTLVPEEIRWIPATVQGRVERIVLKPGAQVQPGTVILVLTNPDLRQQVNDAELSWKAAEAQLGTARANILTNRLQLEIAVSDAKSSFEIARTDLEAQKKLLADGIVSDLIVKRAQATLDAAENRLRVATRQFESSIENEKSQLATQESQVSQAKARFDTLNRQLGELYVRSDMAGQLQALGQNVEVGQQVGPGTQLARVSNPSKLMAQIRISETQTPELRIGQNVAIDTRNGIVKGHVSRIDPASQGGTVGVDVTIDETLPPGARADQSVDGTVELQRLTDVLFVESPAIGQEDAIITLFKEVPGTTECVRTKVRLGKRSVQYVEVVEGLQVGDRVVLSDMSQYDSFDRVRVN
jgi:HlyD family secretion protein